MANSDLRRKYPHGLLSEDYGILSERDLLSDIKKAHPTPYNINEFQPGYLRWQCFPTSNVTFKMETFKDNDPMGASDVIVELCFFSITVRGVFPKHSYGGRRAYRAEFCKNLKSEWRRVTSSTKHVCLNGYPDSVLRKGEKAWTWNKFKTLKGCYSYWYKDC